MLSKKNHKEWNVKNKIDKYIIVVLVDLVTIWVKFGVILIIVSRLGLRADNLASQFKRIDKFDILDLFFKSLKHTNSIR